MCRLPRKLEQARWGYKCDALLGIQEIKLFYGAKLANIFFFSLFNGTVDL